MLTTIVLWLLLGAAIGFIYYSHYVEPARLRLSERRVSVARLPAALEGVRIVHFSDLHIKSPNKPFAPRMARRAVELVAGLEADLICLTGDLGQASRFIALAAETLAPLTRRPVFVVMGNHDHDKMLEAELVGPPVQHLTAEEWCATAAAGGLQVLHNRHEVLAVRGCPVLIAGAGDASCGWDDLPGALRGAATGALHLLLSHSPDIVDLPESDWADLVLCGHTHGGQARLPWFGTPWAPVWRDRRRSEGLFRVGETLCFVTRGVGAGIRTRFLCPPEVCVLTLTAAAGDPVRRLPRFKLPAAGSRREEAAVPGRVTIEQEEQA